MVDISDQSSFKSSYDFNYDTIQNEVTLKVIQYNVQMLKSPFLNVNWWRRSGLVIDHVIALQKELDADVIVFNEVMIKQFYHNLTASICHLFPYNTPILSGKLETNDDRPWKPYRSLTGKFHFVCGGIVIFSKYPIMETHQLIFKSSKGIERFSAKGAMLAKILKNGQCFNVIGTHLQSGESEKDHMCRMKQASELAEWIKSGFVGLCDNQSLESINKTLNSVPDEKFLNNNLSKRGPLEHMETTDLFKNNQSISIESTICNSTKSKQFIVRTQKLPRGTLKHSDPLIYAGDFNIRYEKDSKWLLALLDSEYLNASISLNSNEHIVPSYSSVDNDYCQFVNKDTNMRYQDLLDYFFLSNYCGGSVKVPQQTITKKFNGEVNLTKFFLMIPFKHVSVHHVSDHFPIVAVFSSKKN